MARIAHRLVFERACSRAVASDLFERVAALAWPAPDSAARRRTQLEAQLDAALRRSPAR